VPALLRGLGKAGGAAGYETFVAYADDKDPAIQDAAVRMLAEARDPAAIAPLLKVARKTGNETHQALALRGAVQLARTGVADPDLRIRLFGEVLAIAKRPDERRLAIGACGDVPTMAALEFVAAQLDSKDVSEEAAAAAVRICQRMSGGDAARRTAVLQKVMEVSQNRRTVSDAAKVLGVSAPGAPKK
jgi:HEAT repeat protein